MPSWNIHTAHVERLLREEGASALGVCDVDAFYIGNILPDVYVGYMVPNTTFRVDYKLTHLTYREHIPLPRADEFWRFYIDHPDDFGAPEVSDVVKGAWCHLVCDHVYNAHTRAYLQKIGVQPGEKARIGKQSDFALFGRTLGISLEPHVNDAVLEQCERFPMYRVAAEDVRAAVAVASKIVRQNQETHITGDPEYSLLTKEFFETARQEAHEQMVEGLKRLV